MRRFLSNLAAIALGLTVSGAALAGGSHGSHHGSSSSQSSKSSVSYKYNNSSHTHNYKFQKGFDFKGHCHDWNYYCWSKKYSCYCYYCPSSCCWYYWDEPQCCYYPVTYLTPVVPVVVTTPVVLPTQAVVVATKQVGTASAPAPAGSSGMQRVGPPPAP
jgi:hypothetical protein